jgi:hypothetical protein
MSASAVAPTPHAGGSHRGAGRVVGIVAGSLLALVAGALATAGLAMVIVHFAARDDDGFINSPTRHYTTPAYALTLDGVQMGDMHGGAGDWAVDNLAGTVRVRAELDGAVPVFVGIARERDLDRYLRGVTRDEIVDFDHHAGIDTLRTYGDAVPGRPGAQRFWVASSEGTGAQTAQWKVTSGEWAVAVMRADGRRHVAADVRVGARIRWLPWIGAALLVVGATGFFGGVALIVLAGRENGSPQTVLAGSSMSAALTEDRPETTMPVRVEARLDEPLSRWLWLVKWVLAIPHMLVLIVLWPAALLAALAGIVAAIATGRYPRALFDFEVGVLRWSWRVGLYATSACTTDRYPPFSLQSDPDFPGDVDIPYPETVDRGRIGFQWLLAAPHWFILGAVASSGVLGALVLVALLWLLFTGRYPVDIYRLVIGINRWAIRTIAYAAGLRGEYPPFRIDR